MAGLHFSGLVTIGITLGSSSKILGSNPKSTKTLDSSIGSSTPVIGERLGVQASLKGIIFRGGNNYLVAQLVEQYDC